MTKPKKPMISAIDEPITLHRKVEYWILKIILELGGHRELIGKDYFNDDQIAQALDLDKWLNDKEEEFDRKKIMSALATRYEALIAQNNPLNEQYSEPLTQNLNNIQSLVHLSDCDVRILEFLLIVHNEHLLSNATDLLGFLSSNNLFHVLSVLLSLPETEIHNAFSAHNELIRTGLVRLDRGASSFLKLKAGLLSRNFIETMGSFEASPFEMLKDMVAKSIKSPLTLDNYQYLSNELAILLPYLKYALKEKPRGINILIHGEPGTGKTELTRVLAAHFNVPAYEVASEDSYGEPTEKGDERLLAYLAAQNFFANQTSLIIFDEIEDIFQDDLPHSFSNVSKAWLNRILESNQVPALWLCNDVYCLEPSVVRRFDMVIHLKAPPKAERKAMLEESFAGGFESHVLNELATSEDLVPGIIKRTAAVLNPIKDTLDISVSTAATTLINGTLRAQGCDEILVQKIGGLADIYDPKFTNADTDLALLAERLKTFNEARVCLYGPPGTGKSAYAHLLADYLNKPLLIKKVSDLMDKYVGETEKQIAEAFREANETHAVLLMDEVDSFLRDRRFAQHGYEVTMVNEMLMQMERFSGIFIATTNLMSHMDQAVLRRFDFKSKFDYLKHDQAWELFNRQCAYLDFLKVDPKLEGELKTLRLLTPGDFAITARQAKLGVITSPTEVVAQLKKESLLKENIGASIGFVKS